MSTERGSIRTFEGSVAIVTGGASGIGRALGEVLAEQGSEVVLADLQAELAEEAAGEIRSAGNEATGVALDVTDFSAVDELVRATAARHGRLDYMFNNAGIGIGGEVEHYQLEHWYKVLDVNLRGVVHGVQTAYQVMLQQSFGHIVNIASMAGLMPAPLSVAYATTKHAVVGLSKSLRVEAASHGVRVSVVCPGVIRTPILEDGGKYGGMLTPVPKDKQAMMWEKLRPMDPDLFAREVLEAVATNRAIIIVPRWWKLVWWIQRLSPSLGIYLATKQLASVKEELGI